MSDKPIKKWRGHPCPQPLKGTRCSLCGMTYVCKARVPVKQPAKKRGRK